jgi:hypothetical protein
MHPHAQQHTHRCERTHEGRLAQVRAARVDAGAKIEQTNRPTLARGGWVLKYSHTHTGILSNQAHRGTQYS